MTKSFNDDSHYGEASDSFDIPCPALLRAVDAFRRSGQTELSVDVTPEPPSTSVSTRGRLQPESACVQHASIDDALVADITVPEPLILWGENVSLCAVDVDTHYASYPERPTHEQLHLLASQVLPRPSYAWATHGRGLRLLYRGSQSLNAHELGAIAALSVVSRLPQATVELKRSTRHPKYPVANRIAGPVASWVQGDETTALSAFLGSREVAPEAIEEWLQEKGLSIGCRYPHTHCPVSPNEHGNRDPVSVREDGVFCHVCAGRGVTSGHKTPGWFPYSALLGSVVPGQLRTCVDNLTHWEHAKFIVLENFGNLTEGVARHAYAAACKTLHGNDPRLPRMFAAGRDFVRFDRRWATLAGETYSRDVLPILGTLPVCQIVSHTGKPTAVPERVARLNQPIDLSPYGYPALSPLWGVRIYSHRLTLRDSAKLSILLQRREFQPEAIASFRPKYLAPPDRLLSEDQAWAVLERPFPGISRPAVKLLVAAKGVAEGEVGLPPMIFLSGPTGSAKTGSVQVAAGISGDSVHSVPWNSNVERVRAALHEGKESGSYVVFNELIKEATSGGRDIQAAFAFILNLTPDSLSHKLYVGPVHLGSLPVVCFTDTKMPPEVAQHSQLARRITHIAMGGLMDWEKTIKDSGISNIANFRLSDPELAAAANVILSVVIDEFFRYPMTFEEIAEALGFSKLEKSELMDEKHSALWRFFREVCAAPEPSGTDAERWPGRGWRVFSRDTTSPLAIAWADVCDSAYITSEKCSETDWAALIRVPGPILCEIRSHGAAKVAVRFIRKRNRRDFEVNAEVFPDGICPVELATREPGVDRPRDTISGEPQEAGRESVPQQPGNPAP